MLKLESGTPKTALSKADKEVTEIFLHPELGIHARGNFGSGRVGLLVAHGAMALYDQDAADEVDRLVYKPDVSELLAEYRQWRDGIRLETEPLVQEMTPEEKELLARLKAQAEEGQAGDSKNEGVKGPDSPLVGPKIRHNPRKKKGGIADL